MKYITVALVALFPLILSAQTYTNEVATIINDNCVVCHRSGGIGPHEFDWMPHPVIWENNIRTCRSADVCRAETLFRR